MERRLFLQSLVASVVAAGASLPVGFPNEPKIVVGVDYGLTERWIVMAVEKGTITVVSEGEAPPTSETLKVVGADKGFQVGGIISIGKT